MKMFARTALAGAVIASLAGCSTMADIREGAASTQGQAVAAAESMLAGRPARSVTPASGPVVTEGSFVDIRPVPRRAQYPSNFYQTVTFNEPAGLPLQVLAHRVNALTGVRLTYQSELVIGSANNPMAPKAQSGGDSDATLANLPPISQAINALQMGGVEAADVKTGVAISYTGHVVGMFNAIAAATGSHWEYDEASRTVHLYRFKTATFRIPSVQGTSSWKAHMGGQGSSSAGGAPITTASAESTHTVESNPWVGIEAAIKQLVSPEGAFSINQVAGTVLVRDRPDRLDLIRKYMDDTITAMSRQADIEVSVYRVVVNDRDVRGLNWNGVFQRLIATSGYNLSFGSVRPDAVAEGLASMILRVPERDANGVPNRWGGSEVFVDALSTLGRTSVVNNTAVIAANNTPAPVKVVKRTSYLAKTTPGTAGSGNNVIGTGPELTPGVVETGLNMMVTPHIQDDGKRMRLKLMMSLSTLESLDSFGTDQASIQLPQVASREFEQEAWLTSGETLVLAGFEQIDAGMDTRSPLDKSLWLLGGKSEARKGREMVVITIRPVVTAVRSRI